MSFGFGQWYLFCFAADTFELLEHKALGVVGSRDHVAYLMGNSVLTSDGRLPITVYFPMPHPSPAARVVVVERQ